MQALLTNLLTLGLWIAASSAFAALLIAIISAGAFSSGQGIALVVLVALLLLIGLLRIGVRSARAAARRGRRRRIPLVGQLAAGLMAAGRPGSTQR
jgi:hypothetical protein